MPRCSPHNQLEPCYYCKKGFARFANSSERIEAGEYWMRDLEARLRALEGPAIAPNNKITVITPTGDRPEALALLRCWMAHQTRQPDQWLIVDDGKTPVNPKQFPTATVIRREPKAGEGHTLTLNLAVALPHIQGDKIFIMEDDDFYGRDWLQTLADLLDDFEIVGEGFARYYYLPTQKCKQLENSVHTSLAQTGFRKSLLPIFESCLPGDAYLDMRFWAAVKHGNKIIDNRSNELSLHCALKGLSGRKGIGSGHDPNWSFYQQDSRYKTLISWIGEDAARIYIKAFSKNPPEYFKKPLDEQVTAIVVSYNSKELLEKALASFRRHYPTLPLIIVDGSKPFDPCQKFIEDLVDPYATKIFANFNIGHGRGIVLGLQSCTTPYVLLLDSDAVIQKPILADMLEMMEIDTLGVGCLHNIGRDGHIFTPLTAHRGQPPIPYLHPFFALIDVKNYKTYAPIVHHGAPLYKTMVDIFDRGLSDKVLKRFPGLCHCGGELAGGNGTGPVEHKMKGTRNILKKEKGVEIEAGWQ